MKHIMVDLETMGLSADAAIISIGAVAFDPERKQWTHKFYTPVHLASSVKAGMSVDPHTVLWWLKQSDGARSAIQGGDELEQALAKFSNFVATVQNTPDEAVCIWGNGSDFDNAILATAYRLTGSKQPWKFWNNRCYRTVKNLWDPTGQHFERKGEHHNALDDAFSQAEHLMRIWKE